jgi:hypothetical protein
MRHVLHCVLQRTLDAVGVRKVLFSHPSHLAYSCLLPLFLFVFFYSVISSRDCASPGQRDSRQNQTDVLTSSIPPPPYRFPAFGNSQTLTEAARGARITVSQSAPKCIVGKGKHAHDFLSPFILIRVYAQATIPTSTTMYP